MKEIISTIGCTALLAVASVLWVVKQSCYIIGLTAERSIHKLNVIGQKM